jgi:RNA polymerase sigma-70 factor (sigma-E family)
VDPLAEAPPRRSAGPETAKRVTALYQTHALGLVRLAVLMVGDQPTAEDVVQDAFLGLYRRWPALLDQDKALGYVRSSVLNGCRMVHRAKSHRDKIALIAPEDTESAEATAMLGEANREVLQALRRLPARQREAVVLRYYLDMSEAQAAQAMRVSRGTVKSATSRGIAALARLLKEES